MLGRSKLKFGLFGFLLAGFRDRGDKVRAAPVLDNALGWLARIVEFPVAHGILVRGIEDRARKEVV
jgi:hypothetical protein